MGGVNFFAGPPPALGLASPPRFPRRRRFHRAERKAARAPSIMIIPVAIFILPAVFLIILVPVGIRVMGVMSTMKQ